MSTRWRSKTWDGCVPGHVSRAISSGFDKAKASGTEPSVVRIGDCVRRHFPSLPLSAAEIGRLISAEADRRSITLTGAELAAGGGL